ncbi:MAG: hypothetical protein INQ03_22810 [Candidatus Heimdallarchaeota archaeon]|nr:hypothetical protein [Candidatus Heimdallarchaeota archaeon]
MKLLKRIYYHAHRFRGEFVSGSITAVLFMAFFGIFYPKDDVESLVNVMVSMGMFGNLSKVEAGWGVWASIMVGLFMYLIIAFVSINIGAKVIPTKEEQGTEFFMGSNPMDPRKFYLENVFAGLLIIVGVLLPTYLVVVLQTWYFDGMAIIGGITLTFAMFLLIAFFFISLTSAATTFMFQSGKSKGVGFGYVIYGLIVELLADNPDLKDAANLSVNAYTKLSTLVTGIDDYDWNPIFVVLTISTVFLVLGILRVKSPHYLEEVGSKNKTGIVDATIGRVVAPDTRLAKKFPLVFEQLRRDKTAIFIVLMLYLIWPAAFWSVLSTSKDGLAELMQGFNTPSTRAIAQGHDLDMSLRGFSVMKFFSNHWMFFGLYPMFVAASIPTREVRTNSQDIIYSSEKVLPGKLMDRRVIAMVIEMTFLFWAAFAVIGPVNNSFGEEFINDFMGADLLFVFFCVAWIQYMAMSIFIVGIAMIPSEVGKGRRYGILFFILSMLFNIIPHLNESIKFLMYITPMNYFRPVELIYEEMSFGQGVLQSGIVLVISIIFYYVVKKYRYTDSSLY